MPEAGSCTDNADCCDGLSCDIAAGATSGTCSSGGTSTCALTDDSCLIDPCCNPTDSCTAGVCTPPAPPCAENGQYCTSGGGQCCNPLQCYTVDAFEQRQSCGPTSTNCFCDTVTECVAMDSPCSTLVTCCGGYCQQNGSTAACTSTDPAQCACKPVG
jgi:hypothetical protein